jgi:hypothetical protein
VRAFGSHCSAFEKTFQHEFAIVLTALSAIAVSAFKNGPAVSLVPVASARATCNSAFFMAGRGYASFRQRVARPRALATLRYVLLQSPSLFLAGLFARVEKTGGNPDGDACMGLRFSA